MDFGQPNAEIGQKVANSQLLFLALCVYVRACVWERPAPTNYAGIILGIVDI